MTNQIKKAAIVIGASGGIGYAIALRLAADGFAVVAHYAGSLAQCCPREQLLAPVQRSNT